MKPAPAGMIAFTREDIRQSVAAAEDSGEIQTSEEEMLYKVFDFAEKEAADVMVARPEVIGLSIELPPEEALKRVLESPYTRYPVYRETLDDIVGVLHVRDLVAALNDSGIADVELAGLLRTAYVVPETKDLGALLGEFRRTNQHMAIVVDEYGATMGIVTLEDVLEEIVGDIEDEFDLPDESVERVDERTIRIDGTFTIDDFNEQFGIDPRRRGLPHGRGDRVRAPRARRGAWRRDVDGRAFASPCSRRAARASSGSRSSSSRRTPDADAGADGTDA